MPKPPTIARLEAMGVEGVNDTTWSPPFNLTTDTLTDKYVGAFYWAIMVTTANDMTPQIRPPSFIR